MKLELRWINAFFVLENLGTYTGYRRSLCRSNETFSAAETPRERILASNPDISLLGSAGENTMRETHGGCW